MPNKLKLKRTPEEEEQGRLRKERRREKRKRKHDHYSAHGSSSSKKAHIDKDEDGPSRRWASSDEDDSESGPQPTASSSHIPPSQSYSHKPDHDAIKAQIEEDMFRDKMFEAMGEDERLDSVEAQFNDFAHVPDRWRTARSKAQSRGDILEDSDFFKLDPRHMDDEEYTEWIRAGMYRKTHAAEYAEHERRKAAQAARRAAEKARKAETVRLEQMAEEERKRKKKERESRKLDDARELYHSRWLTLLTTPGESDTGQSNVQVLTFDDIPWPIASANRSRADTTRPNRQIGVSDLTTEAVASFLLPNSGANDTPNKELGTRLRKERKDKLRETFLRFHPDKFEGRFIWRFREEDRERVREAIGQVSRVLNELMVNGI
ncbi:hypothetical protein JR316_0002404 [Psilocybe cubensis]|uniref:Uncharacterized protein n=2 Tax=Psilocybe cubensis TaxID=181762 RepID=A0A8H7Y3G9_PSICU|nr:hypothetical protein JR316_0002404 [Psilocybe cubensis]KAH9485496.1 hypothetical protein JR316_0002404 [Psilocybe cubensis]